MSSEMIERAVKALLEAAGWRDYDPILDPSEHDDARKIAEIVIRAIREPSEAMIEAGANVEWWEPVGDEGEIVETSLAPSDVPRVWAAMIDAALAAS